MGRKRDRTEGRCHIWAMTGPINGAGDPKGSPFLPPCGIIRLILRVFSIKYPVWFGTGRKRAVSRKDDLPFVISSCLSRNQSTGPFQGPLVWRAPSHEEKTAQGPKDESTDQDYVTGSGLKKAYPFEVKEEDQKAQHPQKLNPAKDRGPLLLFPYG